MGKSEEPFCSRSNIHLIASSRTTVCHHKGGNEQRDESPTAKLFVSSLADYIRTKCKLGSLSHTHTQRLNDRYEQIGRGACNFVGHGTPAMVHTHSHTRTVRAFALENITKLFSAHVSPYSRPRVSVGPVSHLLHVEG